MLVQEYVGHDGLEYFRTSLRNRQDVATKDAVCVFCEATHTEKMCFLENREKWCHMTSVRFLPKENPILNSSTIVS
jgi:hypothetical protein